MPQKHRTALAGHLLLILLVVLVLAASALATTPSESVLYSFLMMVRSGFTRALICNRGYE